MRTIVPAIAAMALWTATQTWATAQTLGPTPLGTSYGMFGSRSTGIPLAPAQRTLFRGEPRDRLGAVMGVGMGGPINVYGLRQIYDAYPAINSTQLTPPFSTEQVEMTESVLRGIRQAVPEQPVVAPIMDGVPVSAPPATVPPAAQPTRVPIAPTSPAPQPMRSSAPVSTETSATSSDRSSAVGPMAVSAGSPTENGFPSFSTTLSMESSARIPSKYPGLSSAMGRLSQSWGRGIRVSIQGTTAILQGEVPSDHDRLLAEQLALLEPGIWDVRNELTVANASRSRARR